jgi:hypothetical protein
MKTLFVIDSTNKKKAKVLEAKLKEIVKNPEILIILPDEKKLYYQYLDLNDFKNIEYVCLLHEEMEFHDHMMNIYEEYFLSEDKTIYLPLIILSHEETKGVLNSGLWNPNLATTVGVLDQNLALKQYDTTLYGALIPIQDFTNAEYYHSEVEYYQHFYFLNAYTHNEENMVVGIPKILGTLSVDLSFEKIDKDIKVKNFKLAMDIKKETKESKLIAI